MRSNYRSFTEKELELLFEMLDDGKSIYAIALKLERSESAIRYRIRQARDGKFDMLSQEPRGPIVLCGECARWMPGEWSVDGWSGRCEARGADTYRTTECLNRGAAIRRKLPVMLDPDEIDVRLPLRGELERILGGGHK